MTEGPIDTTIRVRRSPGFWADSWRRFRRRKLAMIALLLVMMLAFIAILAPVIVGTLPVVCKYKGIYYYPFLEYLHPDWEPPIFRKDGVKRAFARNLTKKDPEAWAIWPLVYQDPYRRVRKGEWPDLPASENLMPPSRVHFFGTDSEGVDVFAKMVHGARIALLVGFVSMGVAATIGIVAGSIAGYWGGWVDIFISRVIEVVMCVPSLILILALISVVPSPTIWHLMAVIGLTRWTEIARLTRGEFLRLRQADFVNAAIALGIPRPTIIFRHVLPNALAPVLVPITFGIAGAILIEASLSFLGFGQPPPNPSWGKVLDDGRNLISSQNVDGWWLVLFPGTAIFLTVLAYNLIGEALQEVTDPRLRDGRN